MLTRACLLLFVLWQVSPPDPADVAAARAAEAHRAGRTEELRTLAGAAEPDPWLVVEALVAGGNRHAARAFAALVPTGPDTGSLVAYAAAPGSPADEQARVLATQVVPNLREARHEDVLAMLGEAPAEST